MKQNSSKIEEKINRLERQLIDLQDKHNDLSSRLTPLIEKIIDEMTHPGHK